MRITKEQQIILDGLRCERLSSNEKTLRQVETFCNYRNDSIAGVIRNEAYEEDESGKVAYYVVKDKNGGNAVLLLAGPVHRLQRLL